MLPLTYFTIDLNCKNNKTIATFLFLHIFSNCRFFLKIYYDNTCFTFLIANTSWKKYGYCKIFIRLFVPCSLVVLWASTSYHQLVWLAQLFPATWTSLITLGPWLWLCGANLYTTIWFTLLFERRVCFECHLIVCIEIMFVLFMCLFIIVKSWEVIWYNIFSFFYWLGT